MSAIGAVTVLAFLISSAAAQQPLRTTAPRTFLLDLATNQTLLAKNADEATAPASLAKLMTAAVLFRELNGGTVRLEDEFIVSQSAVKEVRGSTMRLRSGMRVKVSDLLQGLIVQSANDAAAVLAEESAGSVEAFVHRMNEYARAIGLSSSRFSNPHGLPGSGQTVTMREMALLAAHLIREYPERYRLFAQREFTFAGNTYRNRNPLLASVEGVDGLKTGQTAQAGYALVASAQRGGRRLILAMNGLRSQSERATQARQLLEAAFASAH